MLLTTSRRMSAKLFQHRKALHQRRHGSSRKLHHSLLFRDGIPNFVVTVISPGCLLRNSPRQLSASPYPYIGAVSKWRIPASNALSSKASDCRRFSTPRMLEQPNEPCCRTPCRPQRNCLHRVLSLVSPQVVGQSNCQCDHRMRWIREAGTWKHRSGTDIPIFNSVQLQVSVNNTAAWRD